MGTTTGAVAYMASVKSLIANLLIAPLPLTPVRRPTDGTPRGNKHSRAITPVVNLCRFCSRRSPPLPSTGVMSALGSKASVCRFDSHFRSTPMNGHLQSRSACLKRATRDSCTATKRERPIRSPRPQWRGAPGGIVSPARLWPFLNWRDLFERLSGAHHDFRGHGQAKRPRRLEIDCQIKSRGLLDLQIAALSTLQNFVHICRGTAKQIRGVCSITHKRTSQCILPGSCDDQRQPITKREFSCAPTISERE